MNEEKILTGKDNDKNNLKLIEQNNEALKDLESKGKTIENEIKEYNKNLLILSNDKLEID